MAHAWKSTRQGVRKKQWQCLDSTFIHPNNRADRHSLQQGLFNCHILDNSITGMTGHQHNPTTGFTIKGEPTKQVDLELLAKAVGVERVRIADPFDINGFEKIVKEEVEADEPSVIIAQRPCALLKQVRYEGPQRINDNCRKCRSCMKIGCPQ